ncbi:MAG: hypothetical protein R2710_28085, partial [Acidimicrobiales bacterium]
MSRSLLYRTAIAVLPLPMLRPVVPPLALLDRLLRRRWWSETQLEAELDPEPVEARSDDAQTIDDGVGDLLLRRYEIGLDGTSVEPIELLDRFRQDPDDFAPIEYAEFTSGPLRQGMRFTIDLAGPWNGPVEVAEDAPDRIRLATLEDHMEAGWIEFRVVDGDRPVLRIESTARAGSRGFWLLHDVLPFAWWVQTDMWSHVLEALARSAGV